MFKYKLIRAKRDIGQEKLIARRFAGNVDRKKICLTKIKQLKI